MSRMQTSIEDSKTPWPTLFDKRMSRVAVVNLGPAHPLAASTNKDAVPVFDPLEVLECCRSHARHPGDILTGNRHFDHVSRVARHFNPRSACAQYEEWRAPVESRHCLVLRVKTVPRG